jgi:hypothetical protein
VFGVRTAARRCRAFQETAADDTDGERRPDEHGGLAPSEALEIVQKFAYVLVLEPLHDAFNLVRGLVDVPRNRVVALISQLLRTAADGLSDGAKSFGRTILLVLDAGVRAFAHPVEETVAGLRSHAGAIGSIHTR